MNIDMIISYEPFDMESILWTMKIYHNLRPYDVVCMI